MPTDDETIIEALRRCHYKAINELEAAIDRDSSVGAREWAQVAAKTARAIRDTTAAAIDD